MWLSATLQIAITSGRMNTIGPNTESVSSDNVESEKRILGKYMAEITRKRTGEFLRELFAILLATPTGLPAREALQQLAARVTLSEYEADNYESGGRRFEKIVRFATVDCVKAGWLIKEKGTWSVTDEGRQALVTFPEPDTFYRRAVKLYAEWKASQPNADPSDTVTGILKPADEISDEADTSAKAVSVTFDEAEEQAWSEISTYLRAMNPYESRTWLQISSERCRIT